MEEASPFHHCHKDSQFPTKCAHSGYHYEEDF